MSPDVKKITTHISSGIVNSIEKSGAFVGSVIKRLNASEMYNLLAERFGINWFFNRIVSVDIEKTTKQVEKFKKKYPKANPDELVDKITSHKAFYTATIGFTSGLVPGNIPALVFDFITTIGAQAELIYEIALIYEMDLEDETRKGEVLTLIALGAGSTKTAEATLKLAMDISAKKMGHMMAEKMIKAFSIVVGEKIAKRFIAKLIPFIGGIIGASLNASMITLTGRGAKAFYKNIIERNHIYLGELPEEVRQIYDRKDLDITVKTEIRDLIIIKILIYLLHKGDYSIEAITNAIFEYYPAIQADEQMKEFVQNEIAEPTYTPELLKKLDRPTTSIVLTKAVFIINSLGSLNTYQREYLSTLADLFDLPFDIESGSIDEVSSDQKSLDS
jgi:uncharacterized protein (DUF697 family)